MTRGSGLSWPPFRCLASWLARPGPYFAGGDPFLWDNIVLPIGLNTQTFPEEKMLLGKSVMEIARYSGWAFVLAG